MFTKTCYHAFGEKRMKSLSIFLTLITIIISIILAALGVDTYYKVTIQNIYVNWIYYFLTANILFWVFALIRASKKNFVDFIGNYWKEHKLALALAFILVVLGTLVSKPDFKILADETNLLSVSQALYESKECKNYTSVCYYYYGFKDIISFELDIRPALFPLAVSFIHSFTGYRPENIFITNIIAAFFTLLFIYHLFDYKFGKFWGICSMLLLASYPLFVLYYTSGGFEVFNLLFTLIFFWLLLCFINEPTAANTEVLFLFLPLIGQTRYESITAAVCVLPAIFMKLPLSEYSKFSYKLVITPLFFIPVVWLRLLTDSVKALQAQDKEAAFSLKIFTNNLGKACPFFLGKDLAYGIIPIVTCISIMGFLWIIIDFVRGCMKSNKPTESKENSLISDSRRNQNIFIIVASLFYFLHAVIRFAFWGGDLTMRSQSRLAIVFLPVLVYFTIVFCYELCSKLKVRRAYCLISIITLFFIYYPVAGQNLGIRDLTLYREFRAEREFLSENLPNRKDYVLVTNRENMYAPLKYNAIGFNYFRRNIQRVKSFLENRTYNYVIVAQLVDKKTNKAIDYCSVPDSLKMTVLYETQIRADQYLRISKCDSLED